MTLKIYTVRNSDTGSRRMIGAHSRPAALRFAAKTSLSIDLAGQYEIVAMLAEGIALEQVGDDDDDPDADADE